MDEHSADFLDLIFDRDNPGIAAGGLSQDILTAFKDLSPGPGATDLDAGLSVLKQASLDEDGTKGLLRAARAAFTRCSPQLQGLNKAIALFAIAFCDWHLDDTTKAEAGIREMMAVASPVSSTLETLTNPKVWGGTVAWIKGGTAIAGVLGGILGGAIGGFFNGLKHGEGHGEEAGTLQVLQTYGRFPTLGMAGRHTRLSSSGGCGGGRKPRGEAAARIKAAAHGRMAGGDTSPGSGCGGGRKPRGEAATAVEAEARAHRQISRDDGIPGASRNSRGDAFAT